MQSSENNRSVLGILGGGQLGRMLIQEAISFDQDIYVLDPDPHAPCSKLATEFFLGDFKDFETVLSFGRRVDFLTIEIEQVNVDALEQLEREGISVFPQASVIRMIQDKGNQKQFYADHGIPTSPFILVSSKLEVSELDESWFPCFMKSRKEGYDGKGVQFLKSKNDLQFAFDTPSIIEKAVDVNLEFAVLVASNGKGDVRSFPLVDMEFDPQLNLVDLISSPSLLPLSIQQQAIDIALKIVSISGIRGLLAVEFFLTQDGEILVNEIAPRSHNSGHHTIEGTMTSQFEQHLRAVMGWPLGETSTILPAVMINLLGEAGYEGSVKLEGLEEVLAMPGVFLHLYGKRITKPFRKMGHATILAATNEEAHAIALRVKEKFRILS